MHHIVYNEKVGVFWLISFESEAHHVQMSLILSQTVSLYVACAASFWPYCCPPWKIGFGNMSLEFLDLWVVRQKPSCIYIAFAQVLA